MDRETEVFQAANGEDLVILACSILDWSTRVTDRQNCDGKTRYSSSGCRT